MLRNEDYLPPKRGFQKPIYDGEKKKQITQERKQGHYDIIGWLIRQNEYAKCAERFHLSYYLHAGEIYEVDFGINVNAEFSYRHYALVITDSPEWNPLVLVCPLKSNIRGGHPASDINLGYIRDLDSDHESLAVINQVRTIDKFRIFKKPAINRKIENVNRLNDVESEEESYFLQEDIKPYRLEESKFLKVQNAVLNYIEYGYILVK